jgi:hypothetical protein
MDAHDRSNRLATLLRKEREAMADFLLDLTDFDAHKLWRDLGYTSLFYYLRRELGLSAGAAQHRKTAVDLIRQYPEVEAALRQGRICLSSVCELAKVVTAESVADVLPRFFGLSRREAELVAVSIRPAAVIPEREVVTSVRVPVPAPRVEMARHAAAVDQVHPGELPLLLPPPTVAAPVRPPDSEEPLSADLSRFHLTVSREFMETLEKTRDALSHSHPGASTEEILMACMNLMLERKAKQKGLVEKPLKTPRPCSPERIPAHVRREVMKRSGGRCEFVLANGERCNSSHQVEVDHIEPRALGGLATVEGCRAACRPHNDLAARRVFGNEWMDRFTCAGRKARAPRTKRPVRTSPGGKARIGDTG